MRQEGRREDPPVVTIALIAAFAIVAAIGLFHHEMWRDEYQAWLVARDAHSIPELFANLRYEGNPALWHLLLYGLTAVTSDPRAMQVLNYLLAVAAVAVISVRAPFPTLWKILYVFGYYLLFEFTLISRSYALGCLLTVAACALYSTRHTRPIRFAVVLALLANTHVFGLIIACAIGLIASADVFLPGLAARSVSFRARAWFVAIVAAGAVVSLIQIAPEPDNSFPLVRPHAGLDVTRAVESVGQVARAYLPIPEPGLPHFWNTNFLDFVRVPGVGLTPVRIEALLSVAFLLIFGWYLVRRPRIALAFLAGSAGLIGVEYLTGFALQRYIGHLMSVLVAAMWMARASRDDTDTDFSDARQPWRNAVAELTFTIVLACSCVGGLYAWSADLHQPFTGGAELVQFLRSAHLEQDEIIAIPDHAASPVAAELGRRLYYPQMGSNGSFTVWSGQRRDTLTPAELTDQIAAVVGRAPKQRAVLVLNMPIAYIMAPVLSSEPIERERLTDGLTIRQIHHVPLAIVLGEEYFVYLIEARRK
jgi:hypothetical protein